MIENRFENEMSVMKKLFAKKKMTLIDTSAKPKTTDKKNFGCRD
jgi:hypothetical protein